MARSFAEHAGDHRQAAGLRTQRACGRRQERHARGDAADAAAGRSGLR